MSMRNVSIILLVITACCFAVTGCGKKSTPTSPAVTPQPTSITGTVTDSLGNPLDSVAIKIKYNLPTSKTETKAPQDSVSSFTAMVVANGIQLNWRTESETDCYSWTIERSLQADTGFVSIAMISAMGTTSTPHDYSYTDSTVLGGTVYYFRLCLAEISGARTYFGPVTVGPLPAYADGFSGCSPIPVINSTLVVFRLAGSSLVALGIKRNGTTVRSLIDATLNAGTHAAHWNGNDNGAVPVPSGFYQAACVITRHDTVKNYTQSIFVNIADSNSTRVNANSNSHGMYTCAGLPIDSSFSVKGANGEDFGTVTVGASITIYACKPGYPVIAKTVVLTKNASNTVNFVLK